jgi:hypothetical protein
MFTVERTLVRCIFNAQKRTKVRSTDTIQVMLIKSHDLPDFCGLIVLLNQW